MLNNKWSGSQPSSNRSRQVSLEAVLFLVLSNGGTPNKADLTKKGVSRHLHDILV